MPLSFSQAVVELLSQYKIHSKSDSITVLSVPLTKTPILPWIASQQIYPKIYWQNREHTNESCTLGICRELIIDARNHAQLKEHYANKFAMLKDPKIRVYGGVSFDLEHDSWPDFGLARFVVPRLEIRRINDEFELLLYVDKDDNFSCITEFMNSICDSYPLKLTKLSDNYSRIDNPNKSLWCNINSKLTDFFAKEKVAKVVLSRESKFESVSDLDPWSILASWQGCSINSFQYGFQFNSSACFISCSPERLFHRNKHMIMTEALAGTTVRGKDNTEDQLLAKNLIKDVKNGNENQIVCDYILKKLSFITEEARASDLKILKLFSIQHLQKLIQARVKPNVTDLDILFELHPTPAVGGDPVEPALKFIFEHEGYKRGWYSGACGYFSINESDFSVAIRSALVQEKEIKVFTGAGITADSVAEQEWQELESKMKTIIHILG